MWKLRWVCEAMGVRYAWSNRGSAMWQVRKGGNLWVLQIL